MMLSPNIISNKRHSATWETDGYLFGSELYEERFAVERTNEWIDGFKALLIRYETSAKHWLGLHYLAFSFILLPRKGFEKK